MQKFTYSLFDQSALFRERFLTVCNYVGRSLIGKCLCVWNVEISNFQKNRISFKWAFVAEMVHRSRIFSKFYNLARIQVQPQQVSVLKLAF